MFLVHLHSQIINYFADILGALDLLVEQGQWNKCLEKAKQHSTPTLHKYVAQYAANLLQNGDVLSALNLYTTYGAPALPQNLNIYNRIANYLFAMPNVSDDYNLWDELRQMLYNLVSAISTYIANFSGNTMLNQVRFSFESC